MAGNQEAYQQAMNAGDNAAWDKEWPLAIAAYGQAIQEFPADAAAHIQMGLALMEVGRLDDALKVLTRAHQLSPGDPIPLEKTADALEQMGRLKEAAQQYINVAEIYLGMRDLDKAIANWDRATRLTPGLVAIHAKLAQAYEQRIGDKPKAIHQYLIMAFNFQRMKEADKAKKSVQRALRLDAKHVPALNAMQALESGQSMALPEDEDQRPKAAAKKQAQAESAYDLRAEVGEADPLGPMGEAMTDALGLLATYVIEGGNLDAAGGDALQGMELQRQSLNAPAIEAYLRAAPKLNHPALKMNLGGLLVLCERSEEAIKHLGEAALHPQLSAGAYHALGKAYFTIGKQKQATKYLIQSLQAVDTSLAANGREIEELTGVYDQLLTAVEGSNDEAMSQINSRFVSLLGGKEWKQRVSETRRQLQDMMERDDAAAVRDFLVAPGGDDLTESVSRIDRFIRQGLLTLAMDESHRAVEFSPFYLPIHVRMAEIMMREGRVRQAINKYNTVAKTYLVRGENDRAASILTEVLEMAPLDIQVRKSLIELLETEERWEESLDQYIDLADTYHQLGNFEMAQETFGAAEKLASRVEASVDKVVRIKHRIADIDQMRLDMRRAQKTYEDIIRLSPDDERAQRMLIDIHYRQGNQVEAIKRLDQLLSLYARNRQPQRISQQLEELVTLYPNDAGLRSRLAAIYRQVGRKAEAIKQLDALGELQLDAGLHQDAINTIRQIIALNPDGLDDYKRLLGQLGG